MRVNVYAEEMTEQVEVIGKTIDGHTYTGLRLYLHLSTTLPDGSQAKGPFMHRPGDDDSSAVTFWGKQDLRRALRIMLRKLDEHYADGIEPVKPFEIGSRVRHFGSGHEGVITKMIGDKAHVLWDGDTIPDEITHYSVSRHLEHVEP